ncbi:dockerin type I domain-containing protein [Pseudoalteromonas luteoviolacea]|uniref:Dockerin domain-containing protein n=1 Tax=Pseudoalteromonas luteoviolacea NCIMB 1942 TaxID=1365253 RepID=A0A166Z376_9GAMM|nr:dockerin type I domain-containing protein [Pseudoalteromonas luteoviolacea]KZN43785.1 hypothetical protein N482_18315 [Pseudoalteromonas luteoviolacea NCIMB 1942]
MLTNSNPTKLSSRPYSFNTLIKTLLVTSSICFPLYTQAETPTVLVDETRVNTVAELGSVNYDSRVANLTNGHVVTWINIDTGARQSILKAKIYDEHGIAASSEIHVGGVISSEDQYMSRPAIQPAPDGGFAIAWAETISEAKRVSFFRRFSADGTALTNTKTIHPSSNNQSVASVTYLTNGNMVAIWEEWSTTSLESDVYAKVYNQNLEELVPTFQVNTFSSKHQGDASITSLNDGGYVITWRGEGSEDNFGIYGQRFDANNTKVGSEFLVNSTIAHQQFNASPAKLKDGFVVVWQSNTDNWNVKNINAQLFHADGTKNGQEIIVNSHLSHGRHPSISALELGGFTITWEKIQTGSSDADIYARVFNEKGEAKGDEFIINTYTAHDQSNPQVAGLDNNRYVVSWDSNAQNKNVKNIYTKLFELPSAQYNQLEAIIPTTPIYEGDIVSLPLIVRGQDIFGVDSMISLDAPSVASFTGGSYGEFLPSNERLTIPLDYTDNQWLSAASIKAPYSAKSGEGNYATAELIAYKPGTLNLTVNSQFTDQNGAYIHQSQNNYTLTVLESVLLSGNVADLAVNGDYTHITFFINGKPVQIKSDGTFKYQSGLGPVTLSISAPGFLTAERQLTLSPNQADIDFGAIELVAGDQNGDNSIDIADLTQLMSAYRSTSSDPDYHQGSDFNQDNKINLQDLTLLGKNFGKQGPQPF